MYRIAQCRRLSISMLYSLSVLDRLLLFGPRARAGGLAAGGRGPEPLTTQAARRRLWDCAPSAAARCDRLLRPDAPGSSPTWFELHSSGMCSPKVRDRYWKLPAICFARGRGVKSFYSLAINCYRRLCFCFSLLFLIIGESLEHLRQVHKPLPLASVFLAERLEGIERTLWHVLWCFRRGRP